MAAWSTRLVPSWGWGLPQARAASVEIHQTMA